MIARSFVDSKRDELIRNIQQHSCVLVRPASRHDILVNPPNPSCTVRAQEILDRNASLLQYASERADLQLAMIGNHTSCGSAAKHDVASTAAHLGETESLERTNHFRTG